MVNQRKDAHKKMRGLNFYEQKIQNYITCPFQQIQKNKFEMENIHGNIF